MAAGTAAPAAADACVTVTVYQGGQPSVTGPVCQPLLDASPHICPAPEAVFLGYGGMVHICVPDPPV